MPTTETKYINSVAEKIEQLKNIEADLLADEIKKCFENNEPNEIELGSMIYDTLLPFKIFDPKDQQMDEHFATIHSEETLLDMIYFKIKTKNNQCSIYDVWIDYKL